MNQTYQEWSLGGPHSKIYRIAKSSIQDGFWCFASSMDQATALFDADSIKILTKGDEKL